MNNRHVAKSIQLLGQLMELHGENSFKTKSYSNAYRVLRNFAEPIQEMDALQIAQIPGIGKSILEKIVKLISTEEIPELLIYIEKTPEGIVDLLGMKGIGPKKVKLIWEELGIETAGELLYACKENRLVDLKGFGSKTQESLQKQLEYFLASKGKFLYAQLDDLSQSILDVLYENYPDDLHDLVGEMRQTQSIVHFIEILTSAEDGEDELLELIKENIDIREEELAIIKIKNTEPESFYYDLFRLSSNDTFLAEINFDTIDSDLEFNSEKEIFEALNQEPILPEFRDHPEWEQLKSEGIITLNDIKGVIHTHTTYSDGQQSVLEMAKATSNANYEYLVITDHSKSAFYANGLQVDRLEQQWNEINALNHSGSPVKIYKGIESDILSDGSLDYEEDILKQFDVVIASVHSNLKMDKEKATKRLIKAVENPFTRILGHPSGRLLLSREGYPIDYKKLIDACAANGVVIELNANPQRLDIDYRWIDYMMKKKVMLSINPDAHSVRGIQDIKYGVMAARKGGLLKEFCLNKKNLNDFDQWVNL